MSDSVAGTIPSDSWWIDAREVAAVSTIPNQMSYVMRMSSACTTAKAKGAIINSMAVAAQGALESGWGQSQLAQEANNLFGIKAWTGDAEMIALPTVEYVNGQWVRCMAEWCRFDSWSDCIVSYAKVIGKLSWFAGALPHADAPVGDGSAQGWIAALEQPGKPEWATDPSYVSKVTAIGKQIFPRTWR